MTRDETDNDDDPDSKRQKKDINNVDATKNPRHALPLITGACTRLMRTRFEN